MDTSLHGRAGAHRTGVSPMAYRDGFGRLAEPAALIVEDDANAVVALTALLKRIKLPVVATANGYAALDVLDERQDIAIVLMDIVMPLMNGYEAIVAIRRRSRLAGLPIIAMTAKSEAGERERCIEVGASDFLAKPIDAPAMLTTITGWITPPGLLTDRAPQAQTAGGVRYDVARTPFRAGFGVSRSTGPVALVVEDDVNSSLALAAMLERMNLTVVTARHGYAALDVLDDRDDIALVLMDIMMPSLDGYETIAAMRRRPRLADLPIIAVTAKDGAGERERCIEAGASDFIPKPIDASVMITTIEKWITLPIVPPASW
jgi:CheY-like chemotaxis protein